MTTNVKGLEDQVDALQGKLDELRLQHNCLTLENSLLEAICDALHWLRNHSQNQVQHKPLWAAQHDLRAARSNSIDSGLMSSDECLLLEELRSSGSNPGTPPLSVSTAAEPQLCRGGSGCCHSCGVWGAGSALTPRQGSTAYSCGSQQHSPSANSSCTSSGDRLFDAARMPLATPDDMLYQLKNLLAKPAFAKAQALTLEQLQALYQMNVYELSLAQALLENPFASPAGGPSSSFTLAQPRQPPQPGDTLVAAAEKYFHMLVTLSLQGCGHLVSVFLRTNLQTGELHDDMLAHSVPQLQWAVQRAGLTKQQLERIALGFALRKRLMLPLLQEQRELLQATAADLSYHPSSTTGSPMDLDAAGDAVPEAVDAALNMKPGFAGYKLAVAAAAAAAAAVGTDGCAAAGLAAHLPLSPHSIKHASADLELQDRRLERLVMLQKKQELLQICALTFTLGCITPLQVSKLALALYPYPLDLAGVDFMAELIVQGMVT